MADATTSPSQSDAELALKQYFGFDNFRPGQDEIIETVLSKQHCLVVMPTGGGKSVLLSAIATSFQQYEDAQVIFFDKLKSSFMAALASGGTVYDFSAETTRGMSPLGALKNLGPEWGMKWLDLLLSQAGLPKDPKAKAAIDKFVDMHKETGATFKNLIIAVGKHSGRLHCP